MCECSKVVNLFLKEEEMRLPFHAFRLAAPCMTPDFSSCLDRALNSPPISRVILPDIIGMPESYDIVLNEGIYFIFMFLIFRAFWLNFLKSQIKNEELDKDVHDV